MSTWLDDGPRGFGGTRGRAMTEAEIDGMLAWLERVERGSRNVPADVERAGRSVAEAMEDARCGASA